MTALRRAATIAADLTYRAAGRRADGHDLAVLRRPRARLAEHRTAVVQFEDNHRWKRDWESQMRIEKVA
jgi:hypothetical protein